MLARSERMVARRVADSFVLVPLVGRGADLDSIFELSPVGTFIWEHLDGRTDGHAVVEALVARFDVSPAHASADYLEFVGQLLSILAVGPAGAPPGSA